MQRAWLRMIVFIVATNGCSSIGTDTDCPTGSERCACHADLRCNGSLTCIGGRCFRQDSPPKRASSKSPSQTTRDAPAAPATRTTAGSAAPRRDSAMRASSGTGSTPLEIDSGTAAPRTMPASATECSPPGASCDKPCCGTAICSSNVCAGPCDSNVDCASRCCLEGAGVCTAADVCFPGGVPSDVPDATDCAGSGADCSATWCCSGPCIVDVCATPCSDSRECESGCCRDGRCAPSTLCAERAPSRGVASGGGEVIARCVGELVLIADDGEFLGNASSSELASDGICNDRSSYGSELGSSSIFNELGVYGSELSSLSAYNELTSTPPYLFCAATSTKLNPVTKNTLQSGAIDPDVLCLVLEANGY